MSGIGEWIGGLSRAHRRRHDRVTAGSVSLRKPARRRARLRHPIAQLGIAVAFSIILVGILSQGPAFDLRRIAGSFLLVGLLNGLFAAYLIRFRRNMLTSRARTSLVCLLGVIVLLAARLSTVMDWPPFLIPVTAATIVLAVVFGRRFALEVSWMLVLYVALILMSKPELGPLVLVRTILVLAAGIMAAVLATGRIRTRGKIIRIGTLIGGAHLAAIAAFHLAFPYGPSARTIVEELFWGASHGILVGFIVSGTLPLMEFLFGISTDISLLELSNASQQSVLRRLLVAAPGTYNHSFVVGMLAEEAAEAIGANPLLARVGGYYHDIGKMLKPEYFGENEVVPGQSHRGLSPSMSTLIIKSHVKDGAEMGRYYDLPKPIIDIIEQHHGTTLVEYFYNAALERAKEGERVEKPLFRYDGPKPQSREAGIVMLADSVEAATRSLSDPTPARIENTIRGISRKKLDDGQLNECGLTFRDVHAIEDSFIRVLAGIFHRRPRYPAGIRPLAKT